MFTVATHYNPYLYLSQDSMRMVLSLNLAKDIGLAPVPLALAIVLDQSGSMSGDKIRAACDGAIRIVESLNEHTVFMIVSFESEAKVIHKPTPGTEKDKQRAIQAIKKVRAGGGTAMSTALSPVIKAFRPYQQESKNILFLTDGQNGESRSELDKAIALCVEEHISIHAWGVGADWDATELRHMADKTHGSADIIPTPQEIGTAFENAFKQIQQTALTNVQLALWTPADIVVTQIQQVYPNIVALAKQPDSTNPRQIVVPLGSFAAGERRDYLVDISLPAHDPGQQYMIMRPAIKYTSVGAGEQEERAPRDSWVAIQWTENVALTAQIDLHIAHYTHEKDLAESINLANAALASGNKQQAAAMLSRALDISKHAGNEKMTALLSKMVMQGPDGQAQLKDVGAIARKTLEIKRGTTSALN
jgi:Ca-activated chloride channel family protein